MFSSTVRSGYSPNRWLMYPMLSWILAPPGARRGPTAPPAPPSPLAPRPDARARRHAGFEFPLGVGDVDLDPVDEPYPFFSRLDVFGRELGLRGDEGDTAGILLPRVGVGSHLDGLPHLDAPQVGLLDVGPQPDVRKVPDRHHRGPRGDIVPGLDVLGKDKAGQWGGDRPGAATHPRQLQGLARLVHLGACLRHLVVSRSLLH